MKIRLVDEAQDYYVDIPDSVEFPRVIIWDGVAYLYDDHGFYKVVYSYTIKPKPTGVPPDGD